MTIKWSQMITKWTQMIPKWSQMTPKWSQGIAKWSKIARAVYEPLVPRTCIGVNGTVDRS